MSSSVAWVSALIGIEGRIAPELGPEFGANVGDDRRLEAGAGENRGDLFDPFGRFAVDLGERETIAFDMLDDARPLDLRRRIDDAGEDAVDRQIVGDDAAGIDTLQPRPLVRAAMLEEIPQGMPFCAVSTVVCGP